MTLSFLYARSAQVRNRIFHVNEQFKLTLTFRENSFQRN